MTRCRHLPLLALFVLPISAPALAAPNVVASIKPVHSLATALMKGVATPEILVDGVASPHTYSMKPSDAAKLQSADIIFWIGPDLEQFLVKPLDTLGRNAKIVELDNAPGLLKLPTRESGTFEPHSDESHSEGEHEEMDLHLWLNTDNARRMAAVMARTLTDIDPSNAQIYARNEARLDRQLDELAADVRSTVEPVKARPFIVFHDAYQYFEREFGVNVAGSITVSPENMPGAARMRAIQKKVRALGPTCVFAEPQFEPRLVSVVLEGTNARSGILDPEGGTIEKGEDLYPKMMRDIAQSLADCLKE